MNPELFQVLFLNLVSQIHQRTKYSTINMPLKIIDSSMLPLNLTNHKWAEFRQTKAGVKLHLRMVFMEWAALIRKKPSSRMPINTTGGNWSGNQHTIFILFSIEKGVPENESY